MRTETPARARANEAGFSLIEVLVSMTVMLLILGGTMQMMSSAMRSQTAAKDILDTNATLRASIDLIERDLLQVGQGLPVGRRIGIPNGPGAQVIKRPGPAASPGCGGVSTFPAVATLPAVNAGPDLGPRINGQCTDVITTFAADNLFGPVGVTAIVADGTTATISNAVNISDNPDALGDNLRRGDLLMLTKGSTSVLMQVTAVQGQIVTFGTGVANDPLGLNQFDTNLAMLGTINQLAAQAPAGVNGVQASRIRMLTYYVDTTLDPRNPRLVRIVGGGQPNAVGFGVQGFALTYDISNGNTNPASVRMNANDVAGTGACNDTDTTEPESCSENQIRKVNVVLSMKALDAGGPAHFRGNHTQSTLFAQVSLRSMAFVDRYR